MKAVLFNAVLLCALALGILPRSLRAQNMTLEQARAGAAKGDAAAEFYLGRFYANGMGVPRDFGKAAQYYQQAADQGYGKAENNLAVLYLQGQGVKKDQAKAIEWLQKASAQGLTKAQTSLAALMIQTEGYSAEGLDLYRKAAEQGDVNAQIRLASVYYFGARGLSRDFTEAAKWYLLAANQGNTNAENAMGVMNENGFGMPVDGKAAMEWYRKAAEQGDVKGESNYGRGFAHSLGISAPNPSMAYLWLSISADRGEVTAKNFLVEYVNEMKPEELAEGKRLLAQYKASHGGGQTAQTTLDAQKIQTVQPIQSPEGAQGAQTTTSIGH